MNGYVITLLNHEQSNRCADKLIESSVNVDNEFEIHKFEAVTPQTCDLLMLEHKIHWTYPWDNERLDLATGLLLTPYRTAIPAKRVACFMSHYLLWKKCIETNKAMFVFEHDAIFTDKVDIDQLIFSKYSIIGINNPIGATRKSALFDQIVRTNTLPVIGAPKIDDDKIPQGLAGNSAYFIKPSGALKLVNACRQYGAWPNDALMCRQLLPGAVGVTTKYYTNIQKIQSTTTL